MGKLDNIKHGQSQRLGKKERKSQDKKRAKKSTSKAFRAFVISLKVIVSLFLLILVSCFVWIYSQVDFSFGDDLTAFDLRLSSTIYCQNEFGEYVEYEQFKSDEKRIWVDIDQVPKYMQDAFVAIEDQRFYSHSGVDIKRTLGAVINVFAKGDSSYGGSTITQQLVKNITNDNERTSARKIREITRALVLETKMSKKKILEMYMNSIYLSQGVHGVEAAANVYFGKNVGELSLAQCACIAGITQYPTTYDPIINPDNNKRKQLTVLAKMLELEFITQDEYNKACSEELIFVDQNDEFSEKHIGNGQSYFADFIFEQAKKDLMEHYGYTEEFTENYLCNGGLKIYATMDPKVQKAMEDYYENPSNFPQFAGSTIPQSAMVIMEPSTGHVKGIVGGRGEKEGLRVLNRASQSHRQPGSSIKPLAVYAPALEENVCNLSSYISNAPFKQGSWEPKNSNGNFTGPVTIKNAVAWSYNIPAINVLNELGVNKSFKYMTEKLHFTTLVEKVEKNGKVYSDKNLSSLALGGLTDGVTPLEMTAAYSALANGGIYIEPVSYTKIYDRNQNLIYEKKPLKQRAFSEETAFLTQELLKNVVSFGTAAGSGIKGNDTCGKTGTTDDNKDKWFMGFTPHYVGGVWFGYDSPKVISTGSNPSVTIWKNIMTKIHEDLPDKTFKVPSGIKKANICPYTGHLESGFANAEYANSRFLNEYCKGKNHKFIGWTKENASYGGEEEEEKEEEEGQEGENTEKNENGEKPSIQNQTENPNSSQNPSGTQSPAITEPSDLPTV